jgi:hypothetical protein
MTSPMTENPTVSAGLVLDCVDPEPRWLTKTA